MLRYKFTETSSIRKLLIKLEALKIVFDTLPILPHVEENLRRESLLKSSLFSARIEGNPLTLDQAKTISLASSSQNITKTEISNLLRAYKYVSSTKAPKKLSAKFILRLHQLVMRRLSKASGKFRTQPGAIFNQAGVVIYLAPPPRQISTLIKQLIKFTRQSSYPVPVTAAISQFLFEKIHPFIDGNGRVGRLISAYLLHAGSFSFRGLVSFEEFIDKNKLHYYQALEPKTDTTEFVKFFLSSLLTQSQAIVDRLQRQPKELPPDKLLPRRREILEIIKDHPHCSFDFIARRFPLVSRSTLHYDLKKLQDQDFVVKLGVTRASVYRAK